MNRFSSHQINQTEKIAAIKKLLQKKGKGREIIYFSDYVKRLRSNNSWVTRFYLITNVALYEIPEQNFSKCKKRILIVSLRELRLSTITDELSIVYGNDNLLKILTKQKEKIRQTISDLYNQHTLRKIQIFYSTEEREEEKIIKELTKSQSSSNSKVNMDDFDKLKVLGRGTFGKVTLVRKKSNSKIYAMKELSKKDVLQKNQFENTMNEREILQLVNHPFLMNLRYAFQTDTKLYLILDFYKGGELFFHQLQKKTFSKKEAKFIIAEIVMALGHLHKNGIIYRDLKPENVLFDENGHICLTDFGMSKIFRKGETCAKSICGTAEYLAPEMIEGKEYTHTIDWWTLGVLLYELMVGKSPFKSVGRNQIERQIIDKKVEFPPKMSKSAVDLITKLLEKDPSKRLGSGPSDCSEIMSHKFFEGVDWYRLLMRKISPPYKPKMGSEKDDTSNFYREFTEESLAESKMSAKGYFAHFANFSFCDVDK